MADTLRGRVEKAMIPVTQYGNRLQRRKLLDGAVSVALTLIREERRKAASEAIGVVKRRTHQLTWSESATEHEKNLVIGNLFGLAAAIAGHFADDILKCERRLRGGEESE